MVFGMFTASTALCQIVVPAQPNKFRKRDLGGGSSAGVSVVKREQPQPRVVTFTAVSENRIWTNTEGKAITARLLAFSAPTDPREGPTEIIREGKIRLLLEKGKKTTDYPLEKLSQADQLFVKSIAQAAKRPPAKTKPAAPLEKEARTSTKPLPLPK